MLGHARSSWYATQLAAARCTTFRAAAAMLVLQGSAVLLPHATVQDARTTFYVVRDDLVIFPVSFSIPKQFIVPTVPEKTKFALNDSTRSFGIKNYQFGPLQQDEYHVNIRQHRFGDTRKKGGFDCLRHYELMANGCVPVLNDLDNIPSSVMRFLPHPLLHRAHELFALPWFHTEEGAGSCAAPHCDVAYDTLVAELLDYTRKRLSTEAMAQYLLDTLDVDEGAKILFLPCVPLDNFPSYLTSSIFHGLVTLRGDSVLDVPEYDYAYMWDGQGTAEEYRVRSNLWGQGYTLGFQLPARPHLDRSNISQRIQSSEFDLIVFARMSPYEPCNFWYQYAGRSDMVPQFFEDVFLRYPRERVALLYGDDSGLDDAKVRSHVARMGSLQRGLGMVFMREILPFPSEGPASEALRPVDGRLLQPGCFYGEWLDFFDRWHPSPEGGVGLHACVARGECHNGEVDAWLDSSNYLIQHPPYDPKILKHFCATGYALKTALQVQKFGPDFCADSRTCNFNCRFVTENYAKGIIDDDPSLFHAEFGVTGPEVLYLLSLGCSSGTLALQPAFLSTSRRSAVFVLERALEGDWNDCFGPYASVWQIFYLIRQAFVVLLVGGGFGGVALTLGMLPPRLQPFLDAGLLLLSPRYTDGGDVCSWRKAMPLSDVQHLHLELAGASAHTTSFSCLAELRFPPASPSTGTQEAELISPPPFVSFQLPFPGPGDLDDEGMGSTLAAVQLARDATAQLFALGFRNFKTSLKSKASLGGPFGDFAGGTSLPARPLWLPAVEALPDGHVVPGMQVHAALPKVLS